MKNPENLFSLGKDELVSNLLGKKFANSKEGGMSYCEPFCDLDICSQDPCCDGGSRCSKDVCRTDAPRPPQ